MVAFSFQREAFAAAGGRSGEGSWSLGQVGSHSAAHDLVQNDWRRDGDPAVPQVADSPPAGCSELAEQAEQTVDDSAAESRPADGSAGLDDYPVMWSATDWCPVGCSELADSAARTAADLPGDETAQADCSADSAGYPAVLSAADSCPAGCSELADSVVLSEVDSPQAGCSADSFPVDWAAVLAPAVSAAQKVDDSAVRD